MDAYNHAIRRIDPDTGEVVTVSGSPSDVGDVDGPIADARYSMKPDGYGAGVQDMLGDIHYAFGKLFISSSRGIRVATPAP